MTKHHYSTWKLHTLKINKFYVNMQVFYTARNDVQVYSMQQQKNIFRFDRFFFAPFKYSMSCTLYSLFHIVHSYTRGRRLFVSLFNGKKNQHDSRVSLSMKVYRKNSNIKFVYSRGYGRYMKCYSIGWKEKKPLSLLHV